MCLRARQGSVGIITVHSGAALPLLLGLLCVLVFFFSDGMLYMLEDKFFIASAFIFAYYV